MYTYILKSDKWYKVGRAINMDSRLKTYETHNPNFEVIYVVDGDYESCLHDYYSDKRDKGEWFLVDSDDIQFIKENLLYIYNSWINKIRDTRKSKIDWKSKYADTRKEMRILESMSAPVYSEITESDLENILI